MSSTNNLHSLLMPVDVIDIYIYIRNKGGPRMVPCDTPLRISAKIERRPFKTNLCFLLVKKSFSILIKSLHFDAVYKTIQHASLYLGLLSY